MESNTERFNRIAGATINEVLVEVIDANCMVTKAGSRSTLLPAPPPLLRPEYLFGLLVEAGWQHWAHEDDCFPHAGIFVHPTEWMLVNFHKAEGMVVIQSPTQEAFQEELNVLENIFGPPPAEVEAFYYCEECEGFHSEVLMEVERPVALPKPQMS